MTIVGDSSRYRKGCEVFMIGCAGCGLPMTPHVALDGLRQRFQCQTCQSVRIWGLNPMVHAEVEKGDRGGFFDWRGLTLEKRPFLMLEESVRGGAGFRAAR